MPVLLTGSTPESKSYWEAFESIPKFARWRQGLTLLCIPLSFSRSVAEATLACHSNLNGDGPRLLDQIESDPRTFRDGGRLSIDHEFRKMFLSSARQDVLTAGAAVWLEHTPNSATDWNAAYLRTVADGPSTGDAVAIASVVGESQSVTDLDFALRMIAELRSLGLVTCDDKDTPCEVVLKGRLAITRRSPAARGYLVSAAKRFYQTGLPLPGLAESLHQLALLEARRPSDQAALWLTPDWLFQQAIELASMEENPLVLAVIQTSYAHYLRRQSPDEAIALYKESLATGEQVAQALQKRLAWRHVAVASSELGQFLWRQDPTEADRLWKRSGAIGVALEDWRHLAILLVAFAQLVGKEAGRGEEARHMFELAFAIQRSQRHPVEMAQVVDSFTRLARALTRTNSPGEAELAYGDAISLARTLVDKLPLAVTLYSYGLLLKSRPGRSAEAQEAFSESLALATEHGFEDLLKKARFRVDELSKRKTIASRVETVDAALARGDLGAALANIERLRHTFGRSVSMQRELGARLCAILAHNWKDLDDHSREKAILDLEKVLRPLAARAQGSRVKALQAALAESDPHTDPEAFALLAGRLSAMLRRRKRLAHGAREPLELALSVARSTGNRNALAITMTNLLALEGASDWSRPLQARLETDYETILELAEDREYAQTRAITIARFADILWAWDQAGMRDRALRLYEKATSLARCSGFFDTYLILSTEQSRKLSDTGAQSVAVDLLKAAIDHSTGQRGCGVPVFYAWAVVSDMQAKSGEQPCAIEAALAALGCADVEAHSPRLLHLTKLLRDILASDAASR